jgi:hypothetical protein
VGVAAAGVDEVADAPRGREGDRDLVRRVEYPVHGTRRRALRGVPPDA